MPAVKIVGYSALLNTRLKICKTLAKREIQYSNAKREIESGLFCYSNFSQPALFL